MELAARAKEASRESSRDELRHARGMRGYCRVSSAGGVANRKITVRFGKLDRCALGYAAFRARAKLIS